MGVREGIGDKSMLKTITLKIYSVPLKILKTILVKISALCVSQLNTW